MSCESIRKQVLDLALDKSSGDAALSAHLNSCAGCRDALEARRALLAAIDHTLTEELREEPSPLFAARVRRAIESVGSHPRGGWWGVSWMGWVVPAAAAVALVLMAALAVRERLAHRVEVSAGPVPTASSKRPEPERSTPGAIAAGTGTARESGSSISQGTEARPPRIAGGRLRPDQASRHRSRVRKPTAPARTFPEVIVPEGEMAAALRLSEASAEHPLPLRPPEDDDDDAKHALEPLSIEKIEIEPLVPRPLEPGAPPRAAPSVS